MFFPFFFQVCGHIFYQGAKSLKLKFCTRMDYHIKWCMSFLFSKFDIRMASVRYQFVFFFIVSSHIYGFFKPMIKWYYSHYILRIDSLLILKNPEIGQKFSTSTKKSSFALNFCFSAIKCLFFFFWLLLPFRQKCYGISLVENTWNIKRV